METYTDDYQMSLDYMSIEAVENDNPNVRWIEPEEMDGE